MLIQEFECTDDLICIFIVNPTYGPEVVNCSVCIVTAQFLKPFLEFVFEVAMQVYIFSV